MLCGKPKFELAGELLSMSYAPPGAMGLKSLGGSSKTVQHSARCLEGPSFKAVYGGKLVSCSIKGTNCNLQKGSERGALNKVYIAVTYYNKLTELPTSILTRSFHVTDPTNVEVLNLSDNKLTELPTSILTRYFHVTDLTNVEAPYVEKHSKVVRDEAVSEVEGSMKAAVEDIKQINNCEEDELADISISIDGTWMKRGHSFLYGAVFALSWQTGKVIDYTVQSKFCYECNYWDKAR
ncbi:hypothetical protein ACROYT_G006968 [Oculina patagonica]